MFGVICFPKILINKGNCSIYEEEGRQLNTALKLSMGKIAQLQEEKKQLNAILNSTLQNFRIVADENKQLNAQLTKSMQLQERTQRQHSILFSNRLSFLWTLCDNDTLQCSRCLPGWVEHASRCFFLSNRTKTWEDARVECIKMGGDLAIVQNTEDQVFFTSVTFQYAQQHTDFHSAWIGLQDLVKEGVYVWINGNKPPQDLTYWMPNEPNNAVVSWDTEGSGQDCVAIVPSSNHTDENWLNTWDDIVCVGNRHYLCETAALTLF
ncbi:low affinity immunoglobulin epsilon Fc receptor-like [Sphaeramia orbicularis]|nr:low affinity immunoglobulin epsilon Fc receptor-like [Sphaeramia orbicularis]